ncbi:hypothetical protein DL93DRAFT_605200 [Clavulina sp. PMI_390]|nr:hypothetical protein DL93DRAFT_605200 [Clavulina sp. PMI_390]
MPFPDNRLSQASDDLAQMTSIKKASSATDLLGPHFPNPDVRLTKPIMLYSCHNYQPRLSVFPSSPSPHTRSASTMGSSSPSSRSLPTTNQQHNRSSNNNCLGNISLTREKPWDYH